MCAESAAYASIIYDRWLETGAAEHDGLVGVGADIPAGAADPAVSTGPTELDIELCSAHANALSDDSEIFRDLFEGPRRAHLATAHAENAGSLLWNDIGRRSFWTEGVVETDTGGGADGAATTTSDTTSQEKPLFKCTRRANETRRSLWCCIATCSKAKSDAS